MIAPEIEKNDLPKLDIQPNPDFIRQEYSELCRYIVELVRTRFIVFVTFLGGAATFLSAERPSQSYIFGLVGGICFILIDLRNRTLLLQLGIRAMYIEKTYMLSEPGIPLPFTLLQYSRNSDRIFPLLNISQDHARNHVEFDGISHSISVRFLKNPLPRYFRKFVTHSFAMDSAYFLFCLLMLFDVLRKVWTVSIL